MEKSDLYEYNLKLVRFFRKGVRKRAYYHLSLIFIPTFLMLAFIVFYPNNFPGAEAVKGLALGACLTVICLGITIVVNNYLDYSTLHILKEISDDVVIAEARGKEIRIATKDVIKVSFSHERDNCIIYSKDKAICLIFVIYKRGEDIVKLIEEKVCNRTTLPIFQYSSDSGIKYLSADHEEQTRFRK